MVAALLLTALALAAPPDKAPAATTPPVATPAQAAAPAPAATAPQASNAPKARFQGARQAAEDAELRELAPAPLSDAAVAAIAAQLGAAPDGAETVRELTGRYRTRLDAEYARVASAIRARLLSAFASTPAGALEPAPGPELVAVLELSAAWRVLLAKADGELLQQLLIVRTDAARASPALLAYLRTVERDDALSTDPIAGLRLPTLLDAAQLDPADRRRVEDSMDRHWSRTAEAITARRASRLKVDLDRARLLEQWGPAWELATASVEASARRRALAELDARARSAEDELRSTVRDSVLQLLRLVPQDAAARIRDQVDALAWPSLFAQEDMLALAVTRAAQGAEPDLGSAMQTVLADLRRRLEPTRRELSRRAARSEELDGVVASVELGASTQQAAAALQARLDLLETVDRRRKIIREAAVQLRHMAVSGGAPGASVLDERVAALDADTRTSIWLRQGLQDRIDELEQGGRERVEESEPAPLPSTQP